LVSIQAGTGITARSIFTGLTTGSIHLALVHINAIQSIVRQSKSRWTETLRAHGCRCTVVGAFDGTAVSATLATFINFIWALRDSITYKFMGDTFVIS